jgi:type IV secretory pathway component VirB8
MDQAELLSQRYGERKSNPKRNIILAIIGVSTMTATAAWFGFANYSPLSYQDQGYRVISQYRTEVDFELTKPKDATAICSIQALNNQFAQVGWVELEFGPSEYTTLRHTVPLNTTEEAVTGLVHSCALR